MVVTLQMLNIKILTVMECLSLYINRGNIINQRFTEILILAQFGTQPNGCDSN